MTPAERDALVSLRKIGEVAKRSGIAVETLRFYESRGLIEPAGRTASGYRLYDDSVFERLAFVKKSQAVGFTLDQIAWIIAEAREGRRPCVEVRQMARQRLDELDEKLTELRRYRRDLKRTLDAWDREGVKEGMICGFIEGLDAAVVRPVLGRAGRWRTSERRKP
ncbi:MAG: heavy metal-responsive transcriptional regulator [Bryobacterales bacterium]|nr:heavy metal-responsive transcriptional regulator [Bryobacterales bacterium]